MLIKKTLLSYLCVFPSLLMAFSPPTDTTEQKRAVIPVSFLSKSSQSAGISLDKTTANGTYLTEDLWSHISDHAWKRVKADLDKDFTCFTGDGLPLDRKEQIEFWQDLHIEWALVFVSNVNAPRHDLLVVQYLVNFATESDPDTVIAQTHMSFFEKRNGKWTLTSDAAL